MRLVLWTTSAAAQWRNRARAERPGTYRVLCLGDSLTAGSYPRPLEELLNAYSPSPGFSVIDEGRGATNSSYVLSHLQENLDRYRPDIVVAMIGNNDQGVAYLDAAPGHESFLFRHSRAVRFISLAWMGAARRRQEAACQEVPRLDWQVHPQAGRAPLPQWLNHLRRGNRLVQDGRVAAAETLLREAARLSPHEVRTLLALAAVESVQGRPAQARLLIERARSLASEAPESLTAWGQYHLRRRDWALAQAAFTKALAKDPAAVGALEGLGQAWTRQGEGLRAEKLFLGLTTQHPDRPDYWWVLGSFYRGQGRDAEAQAAWRRCLRLDPGQARAFMALADSFLIDQPAVAERFYRKLLDGGAEKAFVLWRLGRACLEQHKDDEAWAVYQQALRLEPDTPDADLALATYHLRRREVSEAEAFARRAIASAPKDPRGYDILANLLTGLGRGHYLAAERASRQFAAVDPDNAQAHLYLGLTLKLQHRPADAESELLRAAALKPRDVRAVAALAALYSETGRPERSREFAERRDALLMRQYSPVTRENYRAIKAALDRRRATLVSVQYPMRSVAPLKRLLAGQDGVIFVDNQSSFAQAVAREGFSAYFSDNFAGDFGHGAPKGHRLLAENIAAAILAHLRRSR
ncbi:MAG: tetratricopeptide repeat protein [Elusimicrobia bacterium]|nr:tetratricopeptide repeat protein [Elusimicrobiota bacterium]